MRKKPLLFEETIGLSKWTLIFFMLTLLLLLYGVIRQVAYGIPLGSKPMGNLGLTIFFLAYLAFFVLLTRIRTTVAFYEDGFCLNLVPFYQDNFIPWSSVRQVEIAPFSYWREFFGIGFRSPMHGMAYLGGRKMAVKLTTRFGDKMIIAARDHHRLISIMETLPIGSPIKPFV